MNVQNLFGKSVICMLLLGPLSLASATAQEGGILILQAVYGSDSRSCDATAAVFRSCNGKAECSVAASNSLCGDPAPGVVKKLRVSFRCGRNGSDAIAEAIEHQKPLLLSCDTLKVQAVAYGERESFCDATAPIAARCDREESCTVEINNGLCGDPLPGIVKVAHVTFKCRSTQRFTTLRENTAGSLSCKK